MHKDFVMLPTSTCHPNTVLKTAQRNSIAAFLQNLKQQHIVVVLHNSIGVINTYSCQMCGPLKFKDSISTRYLDQQQEYMFVNLDLILYFTLPQSTGEKSEVRCYGEILIFYQLLVVQLELYMYMLLALHK